MDFQLTEAQRLVRETARGFGGREIVPHPREGERRGGAKRFISNGGMADYVFVYAREPGTKGHEGLSCFMVPKGTNGFSVTNVETTTKLGLRAGPPAGPPVG